MSHKLDVKNVYANGPWKEVVAGSVLSIAAAIHDLAAQVGRIADALEGRDSLVEAPVEFASGMESGNKCR